jgi:type II secretory pathway pseudopilin PulG
MGNIVGGITNKESQAKRASSKVYYRVSMNPVRSRISKISADLHLVNRASKGMKGQQGFSIVELVVAIVVGTLFILSTSLIINNYIHLGQRGRNLTIANSYAEGKIEALRNTGFNALTDGTTSVSGELPAQLSQPKSGSLTISEPQAGLKQVSLSVTYSDDGVSRTYNYETYIGELGVGQ